MGQIEAPIKRKDSLRSAVNQQVWGGQDCDTKNAHPKVGRKKSHN